MAPGETVKIPCDVIGDPSGNMRFEWVFNTSTEWYPKKPQSIFGVTSRDRGWTRAYIEHSPKVSLTEKLKYNSSILSLIFSKGLSVNEGYNYL